MCQGQVKTLQWALPTVSQIYLDQLLFMGSRLLLPLHLSSKCSPQAALVGLSIFDVLIWVSCGNQRHTSYSTDVLQPHYIWAGPQHMLVYYVLNVVVETYAFFSSMLTGQDDGLARPECSMASQWCEEGAQLNLVLSSHLLFNNILIFKIRYVTLCNFAKISFYMEKQQAYKEQSSLYGGYSNDLFLLLLE